jgi:hypothetical protein
MSEQWMCTVYLKGNGKFEVENNPNYEASSEAESAAIDFRRKSARPYESQLRAKSRGTTARLSPAVGPQPRAALV